jgi:hypothetical protein
MADVSDTPRQSGATLEIARWLAYLPMAEEVGLGVAHTESGEDPPRRRPFALAVRPQTILLGPSPRFRELERQFLRRHALLDPVG